MFEQAFKNIDDVLWKDAGCTSELDYTEQTSWLLFLKYLDALESDRATAAALNGKPYTHILDQPYRWDSWAAPKVKDPSAGSGQAAKIDHNTAQTGGDLIQFVNGKLFPYLQSFKAKATGPNTIEYKIGEIFSEIKNRIQSGYNPREIIDHIDEPRFASQTEKHELSHLYEAKIKNMGNAGRNGGEYYTPRPLIRAIVAVTAPKLGETICDPAVGSAGFLCESFNYLKAQNPQRTTAQDRALQERTFHGKEEKSLAYVIAIMNMILHGIEAPNIIHTNTLAENLADVQEKDRFHIILANPPFGGKERKEVQQNFPIRTGETAFLFLQHFIKVLKAGGRAGIAEFIALQKIKADSPKSWSVDVGSLSAAEGFDLSVRNPNGGEEIAYRSPQEIVDEIAALDAESAEVLANIKRSLSVPAVSRSKPSNGALL